MNNVARPLAFQTTEERRADALAELRKLHMDHELLQARERQYQHDIGQLQFRVEFLTDQMLTAQQNERVAMRKLVRLAGAMSSMSTLAKEADIIMHSVQDWDDEDRQTAEQEQQSAAQAVAALPRISDEHAEIDDQINKTPAEAGAFRDPLDRPV